MQIFTLQICTKVLKLLGIQNSRVQEGIFSPTNRLFSPSGILNCKTTQIMQ